MIDDDASGVRAPPPMVYLACILAGAGLEYVWPVASWPEALAYLGYALIVSSFALFAMVLREFARSSTSIDRWRPAGSINEITPACSPACPTNRIRSSAPGDSVNSISCTSRSGSICS